MRAVLVALFCNNACPFCPQLAARTRGDAAAFDPASAAEQVRIAALSGDVVALVGGEPTLRPDLFDLVSLARHHGARSVVVQTNGRRLAYAAYARGLAAAGAAAVDVSLHGSTAAMHDFHTQTAQSFAQTATAIGVARAAGLVVGVTAVLTRSNYRHAPEIARLAAARGARALQLSPAVALGGEPLPPSIPPNPALLAPYLAEAARVARALGLETLVEGHASHTSVLDLFAGAVPDPSLMRVPRG